jgi:hypothetical protein
MFLRHLIERPSDRTLFGRQSSVEIETVFFLDMPADEGRVGDDGSAVVNIGQLALRRLAKAARVGPEFQACHFQQHFDLCNEWARIGKAEGRSEALEGDHRRHLHVERPPLVRSA